MTALWDSALSYFTVKGWSAFFKQGRYLYEDDPRSGGPSAAVTKETVVVVESNVTKSSRNIVVTVCWLLVDFLDYCRIIDRLYYKCADLLGKLREALLEKSQGKVTRGVLLFQDNAPAHGGRE
ncbi:hypothetical protein O3P69_006663 [Scylla paramamosain]|uniref:Mariner transposase n=1 Tax=Scylla paramamosain TaxID=85552 RepID=A0AAW0U0F4_SCYPA